MIATYSASRAWIEYLVAYLGCIICMYIVVIASGEINLSFDTKGFL